MIRVILVLLHVFYASPVLSYAVVAARTIRPHEVIQELDVSIREGRMAGAARAIEQVIGLEARKTIYAGRPILLSELGAPALIERNSHVKLGFKSEGLQIFTDGRALSRGAFGERIRVLNLASKTAVTGIIGSKGIVWVGD